MTGVLDHGGDDDGDSGELLELPNSSNQDEPGDDDEPGHLGTITSRRQVKRMSTRRRRVNPQSPDLGNDEDVNEREAATAEQRLQQRVDDDLEDVFSGLNFGTDNHQVTVTRLSPKLDADGEEIAGHLNTFSDAISIEDIKARYGGGKYKITIRGPKRANGRGSVIKGSKTIDIAGPPKQTKKNQEASESAMAKLLLENKDRDLQRMAEEAKTNQNAVITLLSKEDKTLPLVMKMLEGQGSQMNPMMTLMMQMQQKEAEARRLERQEEKDRESKRETERIRQEERLEKIRLEERRLDEQRRKEEKELALRQHELQMKQMEHQQNMMMNLMMNGSKTEKDQQATMLKIMNDNSAAAVAQAQGMMQFQGTMFQTMLQDSKETAKQKSQFGETLENIAALKDVMKLVGGGGGDEDNRATWEKVMDKASEVLPSLVSGAQQVFTKNNNQNNGGNNGQQPQLMPPGTVIVAEDDEPPVKVVNAKVTNPTVNTTNTQSQQTQNQNPPSFSGEDETEFSNDLTEPFFPPVGESINVQVPALVKSIDFAIRNNWSTDKIYTDIVKKFPDGVLSLLIMQSEDKLVDFIAEQTPASWPISMPKGEDVIRKLYQMVKKSKS